MSDVPKIIFIVPYKNREEQKFVFQKYMEYILEDYKKDTVAIYFVEQLDNRDFNRGAVKNIGFLAIRDRYPNSYKQITLVFNDVDTFPYKKNILNYRTKSGVIKHFFGFETTLGGIFSITGGDFEKLKGFPNFWTWGYEDNYIYNKAIKSNSMIVDRSNFYKIFDHRIVHMTDSLKRTINTKQLNSNDPIVENSNNFESIGNLHYKFDGNKILIFDFDIFLPYTEEVSYYEMNLTDNPQDTHKMKLKLNNNMKFMKFS